MKLFTLSLALALSAPAFAAKAPKPCPEGLVSSFTCQSTAGLEGQPSDKAMRKLFPALRICQRVEEGGPMLVNLTSPTAIYANASQDSELGYGHYRFSFEHKGEEKQASLTITVSRPPFPGLLAVVGGEMVHYSCNR